MHSLTIVFGPTGGAVQFLFKERPDAVKALEASKNSASDEITIKDDFGQHAEFVRSQIHARVIEDLVEAGESRILRQIQNNKDNIKFNNRAANDPALKLAMGNGLAMNHPGPPQGGRRML